MELKEKKYVYPKYIDRRDNPHAIKEYCKRGYGLDKFDYMRCATVGNRYPDYFSSYKIMQVSAVFNSVKGSKHIGCLGNRSVLEWYSGELNEELLEEQKTGTIEEYNWFEYASKNKSHFDLLVLSDNRIRIPLELKKIGDVIKASEYIVDLKDNWDDEGSKGYKSETWLNAINLILTYSVWIKENRFTIISPPQIYEGPEGSIDILWESKKYRLLLNVPEDKNLPISFYGDDFYKDSNKGTLPEYSKIKLALIESILSV